MTFFSRRSSILILLAAVLLIAAMSGCAEDPETTEPDLYVAPLVEEGIPVDGSREGYPGEPLIVTGTNMEVLMAHDGSSLYLHARSEADGWISLGFNEQGGGMDGANMLIGYFEEDGSQVVRNDLGAGRTHDKTVDGVLEHHLLREDGEIIMELAYPLDFPDEAGFNLPGLSPGGEEVYTLISAYHASAHDPDQKHSRFGLGDFALE